NLLAPLKFGCFFGGNDFYRLARVWYCAHNIFVQDAHTTRGDRPSSQFFESRHTEFAHDENVEWCAQVLRHFISNRNAAARKPEHNGIELGCIISELCRKQPSRFGSINEGSFHAADRAALSF